LEPLDTVHLNSHPLVAREQVGETNRPRHYGPRHHVQAKYLAMDRYADVLAAQARENVRIEAPDIDGIRRGRRIRQD
jgi:hypothetical protein